MLCLELNDYLDEFNIRNWSKHIEHFLLNIIFTSMTTLQELYGKSETILLLMIVDFLMGK